MLRTVFLNSLVFVSAHSLAAADTNNHNVVKVEYYKVIGRHPNNLKSGGTELLVPKKHFDEQMGYHYLVEGQKQIYAYEKKIIGFTVLDVMFRLIPGKDYQPGAHKKRFVVELGAYTPGAMNIDKEKFKNKQAVLKFIEENAPEKCAEHRMPAKA